MTESVRWGPENPHPLFGRKTELVWDGKYDEYGARRPVDIAGSAMPMQKIETVDKPRSEAFAGSLVNSFALVYYTQPVNSQEVAIKSGDFGDPMLKTG
jgi:adenine-specific DNA-methyltransferase